MSGGFAFPPPPPRKPRNIAAPEAISGPSFPLQGHRGGRGRGRGDSTQRGRGEGFRSRGQSTHGRGPWPSHQHPEAAIFPTIDNETPRTTAGHKRKLDALRGPQNMPRISKDPTVQTAPPVPTFGAPILPNTTNLPAKPQPSSSRPIGKALGLVPRSTDDGPGSSDSEADKEIDEEALYAELGDKLTFEHNGIVLSLKSQADLAAWKKERQRNWPTNARKAERYEERWRVGEERKRLLAGAEVLRPGARDQHEKKQPESKIIPSLRSPEDDQSHCVPRQDETSTREERLAQLREKVALSEAKNRDARAQRSSIVAEDIGIIRTAAGHDGPENTTEFPNDATGPRVAGVDEMSSFDHGVDVEATELPDNEAMNAPSDDNSDASLDSASDDSAPEEATSKAPALESQTRERPVCRYFRASGYCRDGNTCRYKHEQPSREKKAESGNLDQQKPGQKKPAREKGVGGTGQGVRVSIFQRLLEQEQEADDKLALQVVKYLGKVGLFKD